MKFSVFTPTHDTRYLVEAYDSLFNQTLDDWEWVVLLNHGAQMPPELDDQRIHAVTAPPWVAALGVGALKRYACEQCQGDYLVEFDHDDLLLPHALDRISHALDVHNPDFLYSDAANFRSDGSFELYSKQWGWEHYQQSEGGKVLQINRSFEPSASSMREIFYAPNHIRVWRAKTYKEIGGHDMALGVCDDFDLVVRTYLSGAKFHHLPECLYLYRIRADSGNTWLQRNAEIQSKQHQLSNRYTHQLVHEWCRRGELPKVDAGGGIGCPAGFTPLDLKNGFDLRQRWPFADATIGCVRAYDFLEHVPHCGDSACRHTAPFCTVGLMNEIYRVLAPGGWLLSATPSTDGRGAFQDPTHCSFWNPNSFWYFVRQAQRQYVPGITARFQGTRIWQEYPSEWHKEHQILYVYADLVALKGQRQPGLVEV
jgi:hypothetical protein